jgi:hypothetical protein
MAANALQNTAGRITDPLVCVRNASDPQAAADLAWSGTLAFFAENLGPPPKAA